MYKRFFGFMPLHYPLRSQGENGTIYVVCPGTQLENTHFKENEVETAKITRNAQKVLGSRSHCEGRRFESDQVHKKIDKFRKALVDFYLFNIPETAENSV